jgi:hypothetical protein
VIEAIASTVAPTGLLFVLAFLRPDGAPAPTRPWPVSRAELAGFATAGLRELSYAPAHNSLTDRPVFVAVYSR